MPRMAVDGTCAVGDATGAVSPVPRGRIHATCTVVDDTAAIGPVSRGMGEATCTDVDDTDAIRLACRGVVDTTCAAADATDAIDPTSRAAVDAPCAVADASDAVSPVPRALVDAPCAAVDANVVVGPAPVVNDGRHPDMPGTRASGSLGEWGVVRRSSYRRTTNGLSCMQATTGTKATGAACKRHKPGREPTKQQPMKNVYYIVKLGLDRISPSALLVKARNMVTQMTGNANFTTPVPPLATVTTAGDALEQAINAHDLNPGPGELTDRNLAFEALKGLVVDLGGYVQAASNGDLDKIKSAGCGVRKSASPIGQLPAPPDVLARTTAYPGRIEVQWGGVKGRNTYSLEICDGDPNVEANWSLLTLTSKNRHTADALESNKVYSFRVTAIGAAGASPVSDVSRAKAA